MDYFVRVYILFLLYFFADISRLDELSGVLDQIPGMIPNNNLNIPEKNRAQAGIEMKRIYTNSSLSANLAYAVNVS